MQDVQDLDGSQPRVATERVVPAVSSPMLHAGSYQAGPAPDPEPIEPGPAEDTPPLDGSVSAPGFTPRRSDVELAGVVAMAISLVAGDLAVGLTCGACLAAVAVFRRLPYSFGEGFVGYRPDLGWPHGIQEDDDFHWNWKGR
jgi:hypothetical protein